MTESVKKHELIEKAMDIIETNTCHYPCSDCPNECYSCTQENIRSNAFLFLQKHITKEELLRIEHNLFEKLL